MYSKTKTIKVSEKTYGWLMGLAGDMQSEAGRRVSIDETIYSMKKEKLSDLAGKWKMNDKEAKEFMKEMKKGWKKWTPKYV